MVTVLGSIQFLIFIIAIFYNHFQIITTFNMDDSTSDPDFVPPLVTFKDLQLDESFESSDSSRSDRSRSLTPFLRSTCHQHKGNTMKIFFELVLRKVQIRSGVIMWYTLFLIMINMHIHYMT